jgi:hypothetical protein
VHEVPGGARTTELVTQSEQIAVQEISSHHDKENRA